MLTNGFLSPFGAEPSASNVQRIVHTVSPSSLLELEKPLDPATCFSIFKELTQTVPRFRGLHNPSHASGSDGYLHVSPEQLLPVFGADSTSEDVGDRARPTKSIAN